MNIIPIEVPLSKTGGLQLNGSIKFNDNLTFQFTSVPDGRRYDQDEFMGIVSKRIFDNRLTWSINKKMAIIKYFRTIGSRSEPIERAVVIDHFAEIADTAAKRYDEYSKPKTVSFDQSIHKFPPVST